MTHLASYRPEPGTEADYHAQMLALAEHPACRSRAHFAPGHFTASAFVVSPDDAQVLLIHHSKLKRWLQPGGHVDPTDTDLEQAARRELAEETGLVDVELLASPFDLDVHVIPARKQEPEHRHFDVRFLFRARTLDAVAGSDAEAARWVPRGQLDQLKTDDSVRRAMRKLDRLLG